MWGRRIQGAASVLIILVGLLLLAEGLSPNLFDSLYASLLSGPGGVPAGSQILSH